MRYPVRKTSASTHETPLMSPSELSVEFPSPGVIRIRNPSLLGDIDGPTCRRFLERVFEADEVRGVTITGGKTPHVELRFCPKSHSLRDVATRVAGLLSEGTNGRDEPLRLRTQADFPHAHRKIRPGVHRPTITGSAEARDDREVVRYYRHGSLVSGWEVKSDRPGQLRVKNRVLFRKKALCDAIERELMGVVGVERFSTNSLTCRVQVDFDPTELSTTQVIEILQAALAGAERPKAPDPLDLNLPLCTASLPFAAYAQFAMPPLLPAAAALYAYTSVPTFKQARRVLFEEKRIGVDALDAVVMVGCLGTMSIFPGAVCCWCLSFGRHLVERTRDSSKKMLLNAFGKQPRYVWLDRDGVEVQVAADSLCQGDVVVVHTGEVVAVDGHVVEGMAVIDQHALTGESAPAEKGAGDRVFASTVLLAGRIRVSVETSGSETAAARIGQMLGDTAGYTLSSQHKGERLADNAVIPTLAVGALGWATLGPLGAVAILNSDLGTGIRMAGPLAMCSSLALCASKGILVKDGRALELMDSIDTVLFDKTGTLTRERPEVGRVITVGGWASNEVLRYAAAAERKFHHPIALAILHKAEELGLSLPPADDTQYQMGYGITVQLEGHTVRLGSRRFMEQEGLSLPPAIRVAQEEAHQDGHTVVMVAIGDHLAGAIELQAAVRPEARSIIQGLRDRGIKHIAIISGDHEAPTRRLAESLGMDRYFAQVLPADKADYVAKLQAEGRKVCFVGDGINDSIALKKADVSISLRGASSIATDTARIVFLDGGISKLCDLKDIARDLGRNVSRSWSMILVPNLANILGVFAFGSGVMTSVITNNVSALAALANGLLPLRKIARIKHEKRADHATPAAEPVIRPTIPAPVAENPADLTLPRPLAIGIHWENSFAQGASPDQHDEAA
jgi:heavy metal translocating P-type ATPase